MAESTETMSRCNLAESDGIRDRFRWNDMEMYHAVYSFSLVFMRIRARGKGHLAASTDTTLRRPL